MPILFLAVDGFNLIRRIFEARQPRNAQDVESVVDAAKGSLSRILTKFSPSHAAVVFEDRGRTWRHLLSRDYKANRSPTPDLLLNGLHEFVAGFQEIGVTDCKVPSYEADDVIGTIASVVAGLGGRTVIVSTDKVYLQLLSSEITLFDYFNDRLWDRQRMRNHFGVSVDQYVDYLALIGDKSNNLKGVPGIGPKSALQLLSRYSDLESAITSAADDKLANKVQASKYDARRCRQLAQLKTDVELGRTLKSFRLSSSSKD